MILESHFKNNVRIVHNELSIFKETFGRILILYAPFFLSTFILSISFLHFCLFPSFVFSS